MFISLFVFKVLSLMCRCRSSCSSCASEKASCKTLCRLGLCCNRRRGFIFGLAFIVETRHLLERCTECKKGDGKFADCDLGALNSKGVQIGSGSCANCHYNGMGDEMFVSAGRYACKGYTCEGP